MRLLAIEDAIGLKHDDRRRGRGLRERTRLPREHQEREH
jgi:hypothetical protein